MKIEHKANLTLTLEEGEVYIFYDVLKAAQHDSKDGVNSSESRVKVFTREALAKLFPGQP